MSKINPAKSASALHHFLSLMDEYQSYATKVGKKIRRSLPDKTEALFQTAPYDQKARMIQRLETEISTFEDMLEARESLENPSRQLWRYLLKSKLTPCSDIFDKISANDTIQVYSADQRLVFASLNFFDHISFTLEQIFGETWQSAVKRDTQFAMALYQDFTRMFSGEIRHSIEIQTPRHLIEEIDTESLLKSKILVKWMSPVFSGDTIPCIISVVELVNL